MGLLVEYSLLPDPKGALLEDNDNILAFPFAEEDAQGQCWPWEGGRGRAGCYSDGYGNECWFSTVTFFFLRLWPNSAPSGIYDWKHLPLLILEKKICKIFTRSPFPFYYHSIMWLWSGIENFHLAAHCCDTNSLTLLKNSTGVGLWTGGIFLCLCKFYSIW